MDFIISKIMLYFPTFFLSGLTLVINTERTVNKSFFIYIF